MLVEAGSYGRQLGRIRDALNEAKAVREHKQMLETVADIKERGGAPNVHFPHIFRIAVSQPGRDALKP